MSSVSIYVNFAGNAEEAFNHYQKVFGTELSARFRMSDTPTGAQAPQVSEDEKNKIMHIALPILGGIQLMGTDMLESMGQLVEGNKITISLNPDTKEEADRLFKGLSEGGSNAVAPHVEFWGYWGTVKDRFGVRWMFNVM